MQVSETGRGNEIVRTALVQADFFRLHGRSRWLRFFRKGIAGKNVGEQTVTIGNPSFDESDNSANSSNGHSGALSGARRE